MSILILKDDEPQTIWDEMNQRQLVFHPRLAPTGTLTYSELREMRLAKQVITLFDRNLLCSLLKLAKQGTLKNLEELHTIALLMLWADMNSIPISAGLAIKENAIKAGNSQLAKIELSKFNEIFEFYPSMLWLRLFQGSITSIPPCPFNNPPYKTKTSYHNDDDHLLMHLACMLHVVFLFRQQALSPVEKVLKFLDWNLRALPICQYTNTYITLLFSNQYGIRPPKGANSDSWEAIWNGCYNQAWDINYLSNWSTFYTCEDQMPDVFLFSTADIMLKTIFINTHGGGTLLDLFGVVFPQKDAQQIIDFYVRNAHPSVRKKPDYGQNPTPHLRRIVEQEKKRLLGIL